MAAHHARTTQREIARVAESGLRDRRESQRVKIRRAAAHTTQDLHVGLYLVGTLSVSRHVERSARSGDREWKSGNESGQTADPPSSQDLRSHTLLRHPGLPLAKGEFP